MELKDLNTKVIIACRTVQQTPQPNFQVLGHICANCGVALQVSNSAIELMREHDNPILLCTACALRVADAKEKQNLLMGVSYTKDAVRSHSNGDIDQLIERFNSKVC